MDKEAYKDAKSWSKALKKVHGDDTLFIGDSFQKVDYTLSKCCNPIHGDVVFGFLTINEGIKIHRTNCNNAQQLLSNYGNRVIKATWSSQMEKLFPVKIYFEGVDRNGIIQDVSKIISEELHINMQGLSVDSKEGIFEGTIKISVFDTKHLDKLIQKLKNVEGVNKVNRLRE